MDAEGDPRIRLQLSLCLRLDTQNVLPVFRKNPGRGLQEGEGKAILHFASRLCPRAPAWSPALQEGGQGLAPQLQPLGGRPEASTTASEDSAASSGVSQRS